MGRKKKNKEEVEVKDDKISATAQRWLVAVILWGASVLMFLSLADKAGVVGHYFELLLSEVLGLGKFLIPFVFLISGYWVVRQEKLAHPYYRVNGLFVSYLSLLGIFSILANGNTDKINLEPMKKAGGYVGFIISYLAHFLGFWGGLVILAILFILGAILLLDGYLSWIEKGEQEQEEKEKTKEMLMAELASMKEEEIEQQKLLGEEQTNKWSMMGALKGLKQKLMPSKEEQVIKDLQFDEEEEGKITDKTIKSEHEPVDGKAQFPSHQINGKPKKGAGKEGGPSKIPGLNEDWKYPPINILEKTTSKAVAEDVKTNSAAIKKTLLNFGIPAEVVEVNVGPTVTQYAIRPAEGVKLSRITTIQSNLAMALAAHPIRIEAPIPGRPLVGVEVPNKVKRVVTLRDLLEDPAFKNAQEKLLIGLGEDPAGNYVYADLAEMPHLLIAGATGSGKSIGVNCLIASLLYRNTPRELKLIMVDPKRVELSLYNNIPHLLTPVIVDNHKVVNALKWAVSEMERRYIMVQETMSRNIVSYNQKVIDGEVEPEVNKETGEIIEPEYMPYIVVIVDELADLMSTQYAKEVEGCIVRLAQMSRAVGIHLVLSTQRPSVNVITGIIKANFPTRVAFQVVSQIDSRTILDMSGAEKLLGKGDSLYMPKESNQPRRIQGAYISEKEVKKMVDYLLEQEIANYDSTVIRPSGVDENRADVPEGEEDPLYEEAKNIVSKEKRASTSLLQRHLRIGYSRAARIMDILESNGIIGPAEGSKPRQVLTGSAGGGGGENVNYENPTEDQAERDKWQL